MANFEEAFKKVILAEGGYVNDPDDAGGETYLGISRKHNPNANMWNLIDNIKSEYGTKGINDRLKRIDEINDEVKSIYKTKYWDAIHLDEFGSEKLAYEMFDAAVNMGVSVAIGLAEGIFDIPVTGEFSRILLNKANKNGLTK